MIEQVRSVTWEAPEHHHYERRNDWYWVFGIVAAAVAIASFIFSNTLFGIVVLVGTATTILFLLRTPKVLGFEVSARGVRIANTLYPYSSLESFGIEGNHPNGPQLLVKSKQIFVPLIILPLPDDAVDDIDDIISARLPEEHLEEPFSHRLLEIFGF